MSRGAQYLRDAISGKTLVEIGQLHGVSKQAVHAAIKRDFGESYTAISRLRSIDQANEMAKSKAMEGRARAVRLCKHEFLCSIKEFELALGEPFSKKGSNKIAKRYQVQRRNAQRRDIAWTISLPAWLAMLVDSGMIDHPEYVVSRRDFAKGFTPENCVVMHHSDSCRGGLAHGLAGGKGGARSAK